MSKKGKVEHTTQPVIGCDLELLEKGVCVMVLVGLASTAIEAQVVRWREEAWPTPIDWHFVGGRARVVCFPADEKFWQDKLRDFSVRVHFS